MLVPKVSGTARTLTVLDAALTPLFQLAVAEHPRAARWPNVSRVTVILKRRVRLHSPRAASAHQNITMLLKLFTKRKWSCTAPKRTLDTARSGSLAISRSYARQSTEFALPKRMSSNAKRLSSMLRRRRDISVYRFD